MTKTKTRQKAKALDQRLRTALRTLPAITHEGSPPVEFMTEFRKCFREVALRPRRGKKYNTPEDQVRLMIEVVDLLSTSTVNRYCPPWQFDVTPRTAGLIRVSWRRIRSTDVRGQTIYHWQNHWLDINGGRYRVGWHQHFMLQLLERLAGENSTWMRLIFASLLSRMRMEVEGDGVWLWKDVTEFSCWSKFIEFKYQEDCTHYEQRIAYCPIEYVGKFARLKTCLLPAFRVKGINDALITMDRAYAGDVRCWKEMIKLHQQLPIVRRRKAKRFL